MRSIRGRRGAGIIALFALAALGLPSAGSAQARLASAPSARVTGTVYDSMAMRPLQGAVVQLALVPAPGAITTVRSVITDSLGCTIT